MEDLLTKVSKKESKKGKRGGYIYAVLVLTQAGSQAVTFAIRSGISIAGGYAIKSLSKLLDKLPEEQKTSLEKTKARLQTKIWVITPAIDLIELISARGNTSLEYTFRLTQELKRDIREFEAKIDTLNDTSLASSKQKKTAASEVESYLADLLFRIEEAIPLISLALTTSGANLSARLPDSVSPGRLLQSAHYLSKADTKYERLYHKSVAKSESKLYKSASAVQVGPTFNLVLYTIFYGTNRNPHLANVGDFTWKEEYAKSKVRLWRVGEVEPKVKPIGNDDGEDDDYDDDDDYIPYFYQISIDEDFDDDRYHGSEETTRTRIIDVATVTRLFFSASGQLLEIEDAKTPVLVLKLNNDFRTSGDYVYDPTLPGNVEWIALEQYSIDEEDEGEDPQLDSQLGTPIDSQDGESLADSTAGSEDDIISSATRGLNNLSIDSSEVNSTEYHTPETSIPSNSPGSPGSLSTLEYLIRLAALQQNDQMSMYDIHDERIALYLRDESAGGNSVSASTVPNASAHSPRISSPRSSNIGTLNLSHRKSPKAPSTSLTPTSSTSASKKISSLSSKISTPPAQLSQTNESPNLTPWEQDRVMSTRRFLENSIRSRRPISYNESPLPKSLLRNQRPSSYDESPLKNK